MSQYQEFDQANTRVLYKLDQNLFPQLPQMADGALVVNLNKGNFLRGDALAESLAAGFLVAACCEAGEWIKVSASALNNRLFEFCRSGFGVIDIAATMGVSEAFQKLIKAGLIHSEFLNGDLYFIPTPEFAKKFLVS